MPIVIIMVAVKKNEDKSRLHAGDYGNYVLLKLYYHIQVYYSHQRSSYYQIINNLGAI